MAGRRHHLRGQAADGETLAVLEQTVELAAVGRHLRGVEDRLEDLLHARDLGADGDPGARLLLQMGRRGQMVGMSMGLEDPDDPRALARRRREDRVGKGRAGAAGFGIEIEHRVDHGSLPGRGIDDQMGSREGRLVKEGADDRVHGRITSNTGESLDAYISQN